MVKDSKIQSGCSDENDEVINEFEYLNYKSDMGNIFQSREFYRVMQETDLRPFICAAVDEDNVVGGFSAFRPSPPIPFFSNFFYNIFVHYGPIIHDENETDVLKTVLTQIGIKAKELGAIRIIINVPFGVRMQEIFQECGYRKSGPNCSVFIDLDKDLDELWNQMRKGCRRSINIANQNGVLIKEVNTRKGLLDYYQIYLETCQRQNFCPYPFKFFESLWKNLEPKNMAKFFIAYYNKKPIARNIILIYNKICYYFNNCSLNEYLHLQPNHLLQWHSISWSKNVANARIYNLYGVSCTERTGLYIFKTSFGGEIVEECANYDKTISPMRYKLLTYGTRLLPLHISLQKKRTGLKKLIIASREDNGNKCTVFAKKEG